MWPEIRRVGRGDSPHDALKAWDPWVIGLPSNGYRLYYLSAWWPRESGKLNLHRYNFRMA